MKNDGGDEIEEAKKLQWEFKKIERAHRTVRKNGVGNPKLYEMQQASQKLPFCTHLFYSAHVKRQWSINAMDAM